jgi:multidrug resistance protein
VGNIIAAISLERNCFCVYNESSMKSKDYRVWILSFIMMVNALSYGVVIPVLYPYAQKFGLSPLGMSIIFAIYSLAQFVATPLLGRWSDRYGRKPILLFCLAGTAGSLVLFAVARSIPVLFIARLIDGITGGNSSVAQAMISDTVEQKDRPRAFGMLGAAFGVGILLGPALGGLMGSYQITTPFWFSALLAFLAVVLGYFFLPETIHPEAREMNDHEPLFKFDAIFRALFAPVTGVVLWISFLTACSLNAMIFGYQAFSVDILHLSSKEIGLFLSCFALMGIVMQASGIHVVLKYFKSKKKIFAASLVLSAITMFIGFLSRSFVPFFIAVMGFGIFSAFRDPLIVALLTDHTNEEDQGGILGINQAYISLGQIFGPLAAGLMTQYSIPGVFLVATLFLVLAIIPLPGLATKRERKVNL